MKCAFCLQGFNRAESSRRVERHLLPGGRTGVFGDGMPDGNLSEATGPLTGVLHKKCHYAAESRRELQAARDADPVDQSDHEQDWREPVTMELKGWIGEGDGGNRGTGAPRQRVR